MSRIMNTIKLASQTKRTYIRMHLNKTDMRIIKLLIRFNFIRYIQPVQEIHYTTIVKKRVKKYCEYYYIYLNLNNVMKFKNLYRPSGIRTISYNELAKNVLKRKCTYILSTSIGFITHHKALLNHTSGMLFMLFHT